MRLLLALAACLLLSGCGSSNDNPPPRPLPPVDSQPLISRKGLYFGYFGSDDAQVDETHDHVNLLFAAWGTDEQLAARIAKAAMPTILDVSDCLFTPGMPRKYRGDEDAERLLDARMLACTRTNADDYIEVLYLIDEPERESNVGSDQIAMGATCARRVAARYALSPAIHICYGDGNDYRGAKFVDWIGVNDYDGDALSRIDSIALQEHQRLVLYPGGADPWRNDPRPFYDYAQANPKVIGIVPFLWVRYAKAGIRDNGMADQYRAIGKAITKEQT